MTQLSEGLAEGLYTVINGMNGVSRLVPFTLQATL